MGGGSVIAVRNRFALVKCIFAYTGDAGNMNTYEFSADTRAFLESIPIPLAVYQYMMNKISTKMDIRLQEDKKGEHFRIFPKIAVTVHKDKGAFNTIVYTDILKGDYTTEELLDLSILPIEE